MKETPIYHYNITQGTEEWFQKRKLRLSASNASVIAAAGKGLETLVRELVADYYSSQQYEEYTDKYKNSAMQRGNDFENTARLIYELETNNTVEQVGCVTVGDYILASPDGLVTENGVSNGLIEIKNHSDKVFTELLLTEKVDPKYVAQMQYQLFVTGRDWCDYFALNLNYSPNFYIKRFYPDKEMFEKLEKGVRTGIELIENSLKILDKKLKKPERSN